MLTLTRREGDGIRIHLPDGRHVDVAVSRIMDKAVRIGTIADKDLKIERIKMDFKSMQGTSEFERGGSTHCGTGENAEGVA